jgi:hypothetical protein
MKRLLPLLLMALLVGACGGATPATETPATESPVTEVSPTPEPTATPVTFTMIDGRWSSYGETGFVVPDEDAEDGFFIDAENAGVKLLGSGVSVAGRIVIGSDDELGVGNYTDSAFGMFAADGPFMGQWKGIPDTLGDFCENPGTFTGWGETGGDGVAAKWTFKTTPIEEEVILFGRPAQGFSYLAPYSNFQGVTSDDGKIFGHLFGAFYCVEASDLIADDLRLEDDRGNALYLIYHVEAIADARDFTASERAAIAAEGFGVPASIAGATPLLVQQAAEE